MTPFERISKPIKKKIRYVLTDIDDTLTVCGRLPAAAFSALEQLQSAGISVVPITGRAAGWCDHIARMWPVDGVVGENGAFYFRYDETGKRMIRRYWIGYDQRRKDAEKLDRLKDKIVKAVPGCGVSADQAYREADLAIDYCEDVVPLSKNQVKKIVRLFTKAGAMAKVSSIHVNGWFGNYDKLSMTRRFFEEIYQVDLEDIIEQVVFTGDSPNDAPMFAFFPNAVGVANVIDFKGAINHTPTWVTRKRGGDGFAEMVEILLS